MFFNLTSRFVEKHIGVSFTVTIFAVPNQFVKSAACFLSAAIQDKGIVHHFMQLKPILHMCTELYVDPISSERSLHAVGPSGIQIRKLKLRPVPVHRFSENMH